MFFKSLQEDIAAFMDRDPAARSKAEILFCYPGLHALILYRLSSAAWRRGWHFVGRLISHIAKVSTGVEIHPGANIGKRLVIDHGTGVVIGETSDIGDDVTLYQGVTLGGIAPSVDSHLQKDTKRHPTLEDGAIIGSGAQVLGPIVIGKGARVGANSVVTKDVPASMTAVGIPARVVMPRDRNKIKEFVAYGTPADDSPDPVVRYIQSLQGQVSTLLDRIEDLERKLENQDGEADQPKEHDGEAVEKNRPHVVSGGQS